MPAEEGVSGSCVSQVAAWGLAASVVVLAVGEALDHSWASSAPDIKK